MCFLYSSASASASASILIFAAAQRCIYVSLCRSDDISTVSLRFCFFVLLPGVPNSFTKTSFDIDL